MIALTNTHHAFSCRFETCGKNPNPEEDKLEELHCKVDDLYDTLSKMLIGKEKANIKKERGDWFHYPHTIKSYEAKQKELNDKIDLEAAKILPLFITDKEAIDMQDQSMLDKLKNCNLDVCKAYCNFFEYKNSKKIDEVLESSLYIRLSDRSLFDDLKHSRLNRAKDYIDAVPLWLVLQSPNVLESMYERYSFDVKSPYSVRQLPEFEHLASIMTKMGGDHWSGGMCHLSSGTIVIDIGAREDNVLNYLSFAPRKFGYGYSEAVTNNLIHLKVWSLEGLWNKHLYQEFEDAFDKAAIALAGYYAEHFGDSEHWSQDSRRLLGQYVRFTFSHTSKADNKAFKALSSGSIKLHTKDFTQQDWNDLLGMAIIADVPFKTIEWIIKSGADANSEYCGEVPIMKAVLRPDVLELLLKSGANVDTELKWGKTALFYAAQYNSIEAVKILLDYGADINHAIKSNDVLLTLCEKEYSILGEPSMQTMTVTDFTPLVYAMRYGSREMQELLKKNSANLGGAQKDRMDKWIRGENEM